MTITEQMQFSVLSAPIATVDRRTLSQAWYSALYGNRGAAPKSSQGSPAGIAAPAAGAPAQGVNATPGATRATAAQTLRTRAQESAASGAALADRRAPRSQLARKIERVFLQARTTARKAAFCVDGEHGRVQIVLQSRGSQLKLIAICAPKARAQVAAALAQARYALALRGIDLDAQTREVPC